MTQAHQQMMEGKCPDCGGNLHHGAWTLEQIKEAAEEMGMGDEWKDFTDCCDSCFVAFIAGGDVAYAEHLIGRCLMLPNQAEKVV